MNARSRLPREWDGAAPAEPWNSAKNGFGGSLTLPTGTVPPVLGRAVLLHGPNLSAARQCHPILEILRFPAVYTKRS